MGLLNLAKTYEYRQFMGAKFDFNFYSSKWKRFNFLWKGQYILRLLISRKALII